jgi:uncharacterized protein
MRKQIEIVVSPETEHHDELLRNEVLKILGIRQTEGIYIRRMRRSIDARSRHPKVNLLLEIFIDEQPSALISYKKDYKNVSHAQPVIIVGAGPAGLFAALRCVELGYKPVLLERGKDVRSRRWDLAAINKEHKVNPDSNYCFGEGGAGTYSDGKLYTRSKKRGDVNRILEILVAHGAKEDILIDTHPHIGTNKLPALIVKIRESILNAGGEVYFDSRVTDFILKGQEIKGVLTQNGTRFEGLGVILATGHSARDIFSLLAQKNILIEQKPFALGVRIEHQQSLIDKIQYHCNERGAYLPASSYALVSQVNYNQVTRGVFSFCMCPGGFIVPSATSQEEVVVNGMSPSKRDSEFANSGIVVAIEKDDLKAYSNYGPFAGLEFQKEIEKKAWIMGGKTQTAPAQRLLDFTNNKVSTNLLKTSYQPGLKSGSLYEILPPPVSQRLKEAFKIFGEKMKGFLTNEAQLVGVESRTSSPVLVPRHKDTLEHVQVKRMFPCGEGAGYAGGIVSAAMDGERCAEKLVEFYGK